MSAMSPMTADAVASAAGARAGQQQRADRVGLDADGVGHTVDLADHRTKRHHGRVDTLLDAGRRALRHAEQLDAITEFARRMDVGQ